MQTIGTLTCLGPTPMLTVPTHHTAWIRHHLHTPGAPPEMPNHAAPANLPSLPSATRIPFPSQARRPSLRHDPVSRHNPGKPYDHPPVSTLAPPHRGRAHLHASCASSHQTRQSTCRAGAGDPWYGILSARLATSGSWWLLRMHLDGESGPGVEHADVLDGAAGPPSS